MDHADVFTELEQLRDKSKSYIDKACNVQKTELMEMRANFVQEKLEMENKSQMREAALQKDLEKEKKLTAELQKMLKDAEQKNADSELYKQHAQEEMQKLADKLKHAEQKNADMQRNSVEMTASLQQNSELLKQREAELARAHQMVSSMMDNEQKLKRTNELIDSMQADKQKLAEAEEKIAYLQNDSEVLKLVKAELETRKSQMAQMQKSLEESDAEKQRLTMKSSRDAQEIVPMQHLLQRLKALASTGFLHDLNTLTSLLKEYPDVLTTPIASFARPPKHAFQPKVPSIGELPEKPKDNNGGKSSDERPVWKNDWDTAWKNDPRYRDPGN